MAKPRQSQAPDTAAEILRATRAEWVTKAQIEEIAGLSKRTTVLWVRGLEARGILKSRLADKAPGAPGPTPQEFKLSSQWGGL